MESAQNIFTLVINPVLPLGRQGVVDQNALWKKGIWDEGGI
jgi:hypothetical protein